MSHKRLSHAIDAVRNERLGLLFASAQLAANLKTFNHLLDSKYTDYSAIAHAIRVTESTRKLLKDAMRGENVI